MNNPIMMTDSDGRQHLLTEVFQSNPDHNTSPQQYGLGRGGSSDAWNSLNNWSPSTSGSNNTLGGNTAYQAGMDFLYGDSQGTFYMTNHDNVMRWWTDLGQESQGNAGTYNMLLRKKGYRTSNYNPYQEDNSWGWDNFMDGISALEGGISAYGSGGYVLNNEIVRYNKNGAYKLSGWGTKMKNGQSYWNNNLVKNARNSHLSKLKGFKPKIAGGAFIVADVALSGEVKPSTYINGFMLGIAGTGVGTVVGGAWFLIDNGVGAYNYFNGREFQTVSDIIDGSDWGKNNTIEMYEGVY